MTPEQTRKVVVGNVQNLLDELDVPFTAGRLTIQKALAGVGITLTQRVLMDVARDRREYAHLEEEKGVEFIVGQGLVEA